MLTDDEIGEKFDKFIDEGWEENIKGDNEDEPDEIDKKAAIRLARWAYEKGKGTEYDQGYNAGMAQEAKLWKAKIEQARADERAKCNSTCDICKSTKNLSVSFCKKCIVNLETEAEQRGFQEGYNKGLKDNSLKTAYEDHSKNHRDGDTATKYCYFCACQANEKPKAARKKKKED